MLDCFFQCYRNRGFTKVSPFLFLLTTIILGIHKPSLAKPTVKPMRSPASTISVQMLLSGDIIEGFQFDGPLGDQLVGVPLNPNAAAVQCDNKTLFRQVLQQHKKSIEVWIHLACMVKGQRIDLRPSSLFIQEKGDSQVTVHSSFTNHIQKIQIEFKDVQIKPPKSK
jgi:hypothetical protein